MEDSREDDAEEEEQCRISPEIIQHAIAEIERSRERKRKVRQILLQRLNVYFYEISEYLGMDEVITTRRIVGCLHDFKNLIVSLTELCIWLSHPRSKVHEVFDLMYDLGAYLETIIKALHSWCIRNQKVFGEIVEDMLDSLLKISVYNAESWLYSVLISPLVLNIINAMSSQDHRQFRDKWALKRSELMKQIAGAVYKCGDFSCQYYLMSIFKAWARWTAGADALSTINASFIYVEPAARKTLLVESDTELCIRRFLNALNLSVMGPKSIIPIRCLYLFICDKQVRPPQCNNDSDFWVDFSIGSGRIHVFYSLPGASLVSLSIRRDQIDSVCLNWVVNEGDETQESTVDNTSHKSSLMKHEKVLFFHVILNVDFDAITKDAEELLDRGYRSVYFAFRDGELVEKVMKDLNYHQHMCGTKNCERPRTLRKLLASHNKLRYSKSWCPESQVFGLDNSFPQDNQNESEDEFFEQDQQEALFESEQEIQNLSQATNSTGCGLSISFLQESLKDRSVRNIFSNSNMSFNERQYSPESLRSSSFVRQSPPNFNVSDNDTQCSSVSETDVTHLNSLRSVPSTRTVSVVQESLRNSLARSVSSFQESLKDSFVRQSLSNASISLNETQCSPESLKNSCMQQSPPNASISINETQCSPKSLRNSFVRERSPNESISINVTQCSPESLRNSFARASSSSATTSPSATRCSPECLRDIFVSKISPVTRIYTNEAHRSQETFRDGFVQRDSNMDVSDAETLGSPENLRDCFTNHRSPLANLSMNKSPCSSKSLRRKSRFMRHSSPIANITVNETLCSPMSEIPQLSPRRFLNITEDDVNEIPPTSSFHDRSGSLSPVFGYSKTLVNEEIPGRSPLRPSVSQMPKTANGKLPCYVNSHKERVAEWEKKTSENLDYDPYDIHMDSEEMRNYFFPKVKVKTYARKSKKNKIQLENRKRRLDLGEETSKKFKQRIYRSRGKGKR